MKDRLTVLLALFCFLVAGQVFAQDCDGGWEVVPLPPGVQYFQAVTWCGDRFLAAGWNGTGRLYQSRDGRNWEESFRPSNGFNFNGVFCSPSLGLVLASDCTVFRSKDFNAWRKFRACNSSPFLLSAAFGNDRYVVVGEVGRILTSRDGKSWKVRRAKNGEVLTGVAFDGKHFVAVGWSGSIVDGFCGKIFTSRTGIRWERRGSCSLGVLNAVACSPDLFVAVGEGNAVWRSTDGKQWERVDHLPTEADWNAITFTGSKFIAAGDGGALMTSEDGLLWTVEATGYSDLWGVASNGQVSVAVTPYGTILACGLSSP